MTVISRNYNRIKDYNKVCDFLIRTYKDNDNFQNWLQPRWEYMHYHPYFFNREIQKNHNRIRLWEDDKKVVALVNFELHLGYVYLHIDENYPYLKNEMLEYAQNLYGEFEGRKRVIVYINESEEEFKEIAKSKGFELEDKHSEYMSVFRTENDIPEVTLPEGFKIISLDDEDDLYKVSMALWRGFNHEGEMDLDLTGRRLMELAPNFRRDLNTVIVAPGGNYVSYSGMWYDEKNKYGYVEPVATDPNYRKMGLGKAAVLEGVRRCKALGAKKVYVATNKTFYLRLGFETIFKKEAWVKYFD